MTPPSMKQQLVTVLTEDFGLQAARDPPLGEYAIQELEKQIEAFGSPTTPKPVYPCATQQSLSHPHGIVNDLQRIWIGINDEIPRWRPGSTINYAMSMTGWPSTQHFDLAHIQLRAAAEEWNSDRIGVTFNLVDNLEHATFVCVYAGPRGGILAQAFFPSNQKLSYLTIYEYAFHPSNVSKLKNVLLHELGHVLGLRHEFAAQEGHAVEFGSSNPDSVMAYNDPPMMQKSDIESTRAFYHYSEKCVGTYPIRDYLPNN